MALRDLLRHIRRSTAEKTQNILNAIPQAPFSSPKDFANKVLLPQKNTLIDIASRLPQAPFQSPGDFVNKITQPVRTGVSFPVSGARQFGQRTVLPLASKLPQVSSPIGASRKIIESGLVTPQFIGRLGVGATLNALNKPLDVVYPGSNPFTSLLFGKEPIKSTSVRLGEAVQGIRSLQKEGDTKAKLLGLGQSAGLGLGYGFLAGIEAIPGAGKLTKGLGKLAEKYGGKIIRKADEVFDPLKYAKGETAKAELERFGGKIPTIVDSAKEETAKLKENFIENQAYILKKLEKYGMDTHEMNPYTAWKQQTGMVYKSDSIANLFLADNFDYKRVVKSIRKNGGDVDEFKQYLIARHAAAYNRAGYETGRDLIKDSKLIEARKELYEPFAIQYDATIKELQKLLVKYDFNSQELIDTLQAKYPNYVRMSRVFDEKGATTVNKKTGGSAIAGTTKDFIKKAKGSSRPIEDPILTLHTMVRELHEMIEKKKTAQMFLDFQKLDGNPFGITVLKNPDDALKRKELIQARAVVIKTRELMYKWLSSGNKEVRALTRKINKLQEKGLNRALQQEAPNAPKAVAKVSIKNGKVKETAAVLPPTKIYRLVDSFVREPDKVIQKIQNRTDLSIEERDLIIKRLSAYKSKLDESKNKSAEIKQQLKEYADIEKSPDEFIITIPTSRGKLIYTADPEAMRALKGLDVTALHPILQALSQITRLFKLTTTGGFAGIGVVAKQLSKDALSSYIFGSKNLRAFTPQAYIGALLDIYRKTDIYKDAVRNGALTSSFDVIPKAGTKNIKYLEKRFSGKRALQTFESAMAALQEAEYLAQYKTLVTVYEKQGLNAVEAHKLASQNAKDFLTDFSRKGNYSKFIGSVFPYISAAINGANTTITAFKKRPLETGTKLIVAGYAPITAITLWNLSDEERAKRYRDVREFDRDGNFIIVLPWRDESGELAIFTVPIQGGLNYMLRPARKIIENMYDIGDPISFKYLADSVLGSVTPFSLDMQKNVRTLTPQPIQPLVDVVTNTKYGGGKVNPLEHLETKDQAFDNTSDFARFVGGRVNMAPIEVDYLFKGYLSEAYQLGTNALDKALIGAGLSEKDMEDAGGKSLFKQLKDVFTDPYTGEIEAEKSEIIEKYEKRENSIENREYKQATKIYAELKKMSIEESSAYIEKLGATNPELAERVIDMKRAEAKGMTKSDKAMLKLKVSSGGRAAYIWNELLKGKSTQEQAQVIKELTDKRIITDTVFEQLKVFKKESQD